MHENLIRIKAVNEVLKNLNQDYVFVGGATVSLYASAPTVQIVIRPTDDVDILVELASYAGYAELDQRLLDIGFRNDITSGVICRYKIQGITVDVIPTNPESAPGSRAKRVMEERNLISSGLPLTCAGLLVGVVRRTCDISM